MSQYINKIRTNAGDLQIDYEALANLPTISNPNLLINGDFQIWQRSESFSNIENQYTADRWLIKNAKTKTSLVEMSTDVPNGDFMRYSIHITETTEENSYLRYMFEYSLRGTYTLSFWYKTNAAFNTYIYDDGAFVHLGSQTTLNTWSKAVYTFTVTSMTFLNIIHAMSIGNAYITGVKLECGSTATPFVSRFPGEELALCQRYFFKLLTTYPLTMTQQNVAEAYSYMLIPLPVSMRAAPTITYKNVKLMKNGVGGNWFDLTSITCVGFSKMGVTLKLDLLDATYDIGIPYFLILPNSGYIEFDAEIY